MKALMAGALVLGVAIPSAALADTDVGARVAARSHFFGFENVDQKNGKVDRDKVIISWFSVQSYAVAAKGRVFLLDSYIFRLVGHAGLRAHHLAGAGRPRPRGDLHRPRPR